MKKILILLLLFTGLALSQNFTIRSLSAHGSPINTDLFLFSNAAGGLTKLSYLAFLQSLDDENWIWTGTHAFSSTVIFNDIVTFNAGIAGSPALSGTWTFNGDATFNQTATFNGGVDMTNADYLRLGTVGAALGGSIYYVNASRDLILYRYNDVGGIDTIVSWNKLHFQTNNTHGDWTFNGETTFNGGVDMTNADYLRLGTVGAALGGSIYYVNASRDLILYRNNDVGGIDTVVSWNKLLWQDNTILGDWTFSGGMGLAPGVVPDAAGKFGVTASSYFPTFYQNSVDTLMTWRKVLYENNTIYGSWFFNGSMTAKSLTPVTDAASNFISAMSGDNLYGGTFVCNVDDGDLDLPHIYDGMKFFIVTMGDIEIVIEPYGAENMILDGLQLHNSDSATNTGVAGDVIFFQYYDTNTWLVTSDGWLDLD